MKNNMTTLVVGASGATGKHAVEQMLNMGQSVKIVVRSSSKIPDAWKRNNKISIIEANISELSAQEMAAYLKDCQGIISCLGHNLTLAGIYGKPRKLVTDAVRLICAAIKENAPEEAVRFALMNTSGNMNRDLDEPVSMGQKLVVALIRLLVPPHSDNENAADFLRNSIGQNHPLIEWVTVRPDSLVDEDKVTKYKAYASPTRSAIFDPGKTSRINVGHFMAKLIVEESVWYQWKGQMPVIYDKVG